MRDLMQSYHANPALVPPLNPQLGGRVSQEGGLRVTLPVSVGKLHIGTHEIVLNEREIHVAVAAFGADRVIRIYDYNAYEQHFKRTINVLMIGTGIFALLTIWLAFGLSGLLVRQVAGLARQVSALRPSMAGSLNSGKYDEIEVVELVETFNDYHRRMAHMIGREKEFTSNVSHELRTPLTTIRTSCELIEQDAAISEKSRARLHQIERATTSMTDLVNALLLLARDELTSDVGPIRLAAAIADALDGFAHRLAPRNIDIAIHVDGQLRVNVNRSVLAIVLSNLIDNAVRHTIQGYIRISWVAGELRIEDSGCGIPHASLPLVFERFYRVSSVNEDTHGFGIGLAIVKKMCDRYQWTIRIESDVGRGTCVFLCLPLLEQNA